MAKITAGINSRIRKALPGFFGCTWKGIAVIKAMSVGFNPRTAIQQDNRLRFGRCSSFASLINGRILLPYQSPFVRKHSGYNYFIAHNYKKFTTSPNYKTVFLTNGSIPPPMRISILIFPHVDFARIWYIEDDYYRDTTNLWVTGLMYLPGKEIFIYPRYDFLYDSGDPLPYYWNFESGQQWTGWIFFYRKDNDGRLIEISKTIGKGTTS